MSGPGAEPAQMPWRSRVENAGIANLSNRKPLEVYPQPRHGSVTMTEAKSICRHFLRGRCTFGDDCSFSHEVASNPVPWVRTGGGSTSSHGHSSFSNTGG
eukprot:s4115_g4.t1